MKVYFSSKWKLIQKDLEKIAVGASVAVLGALATYLQENVGNMDFSNVIEGTDITPIVVMVNSILVNVIRKVVIETTYTE